MLTIDECLNISNEWINKQGTKDDWYVNIIFDHENEYLVCIDNKLSISEDLPILSINKDNGEISYFFIIEEGAFEKIKNSEVVYGNFSIEDDE